MYNLYCILTFTFRCMKVQALNFSTSVHNVKWMTFMVSMIALYVKEVSYPFLWYCSSLCKRSFLPNYFVSLTTGEDEKIPRFVSQEIFIERSRRHRPVRTITILRETCHEVSMNSVQRCLNRSIIYICLKIKPNSVRIRFLMWRFF